MGATFIKDPQNNLHEVSNLILIEKETPAWEPDADMQWAKGVCESDTQSGFTYKVLQMISNGYVYTDIVVPTGGAVKTSDGSYYTTSTKHTWDDTNARVAQAPQNAGLKLRWLIYYYNSETPSITLLDDIMYACFDGVKFASIFQSKRMLQYFDIINGADLASSVRTMSNMFVNCFSLQSVPLFDTSSVITMGTMFTSCSSLQEIPQLDTSNVTNMRYMFQSCYSLQTMPQLDTNNVIDMNGMFSGCRALQIIPLFDTSNVTNMQTMFEDCSSLKIIPLFDTSNVTTMSSMFYNCYSLQTIPQFDTSSVTSMYGMFYTCRSLQTTPLLDTSNVANMSSMFSGCSSVSRVNLNINSVTSTSSMFSGCSNLEFLTLTNIGVNLSISNSTKFSVDTLVDIIANLKDLTGLTAQTLTMGTTNKNKLTTAQIQVAIDKNWSVA